MAEWLGGERTKSALIMWTNLGKWKRKENQTLARSKHQRSCVESCIFFSAFLGPKSWACWSGLLRRSWVLQKPVDIQIPPVVKVGRRVFLLSRWNRLSNEEKFYYEMVCMAGWGDCPPLRHTGKGRPSIDWWSGFGGKWRVTRSMDQILPELRGNWSRYWLLDPANLPGGAGPKEAWHGNAKCKRGLISWRAPSACRETSPSPNWSRN